MKDYEMKKNEVKALVIKYFGEGCFSEEYTPEFFKYKEEDSKLIGFATGLDNKITSIVVHEDHRNKGVAKELISEMMKVLNYPIIVESWADNGKSNLKSSLEENGFKQTEIIKNKWRDESLYFGFECVRCGSPCSCSAVIFELEAPKQSQE